MQSGARLVSINEIWSPLMQNLCIQQSGSHTVHSNSIWSILGSKRTRIGCHCPLRCIVMDRVPESGSECVDTAHLHHGPFGFIECIEGVSIHSPHTFYIDIEYPIPCMFVYLVMGSGRKYPGVVHHDLQRTETVERLFDRLGDTLITSHVPE